MAARVCERNRSRASESGLKGESDDGFVPGESIRRPRHVHCRRSGVHAQADSDRGGARETGVPREDRDGQSAARIEIEYAGGCRDRAGLKAGFQMEPIIETRSEERRVGKE